MSTNDGMPSQEDFQNAFDATMECVDLLEYLDDSRKGDEWFDEPVEDSDILDILLPEMILSQQTGDLKFPVPRKAIRAVEQTLARVHSSAVSYLDEWGISYCEVAWKLCVWRTAAPWQTLSKLIEHNPELTSLQQSIFFNFCYKEESKGLRLKNEQLAVSLWDRVAEKMADTPFIDRKRLVAHVTHELVSAGWNRGSTEKLDEAVGLVGKGEKKRRGRKRINHEDKEALLRRCEEAIESGHCENEARFVEMLAVNNEKSPATTRRWLKDARENRKSSH